MEAVTAKARKWGNSLGITLPKDIVRREGIRAGEDLELFVVKQSDVFRNLFGSMKKKKKLTAKSTANLLREIDRELYPD